MDKTPRPTYSVSIRLQRTTTEHAFVSVPVTSDLAIDSGDGTARIDTDKLMQRATEMGIALGNGWQIEERHVRPHPIQTPPSDGPVESDGNDS